MGITQPTMMWHTKYFGVTKDADNGSGTLHYTISGMSTCTMDSSAAFPHFTLFQLLANPPTCIAALYAKSKTGIASKYSLQICKTTTTNLPTQIAPDVWILTTLSHSTSQHHDLNMPRETHRNYTYSATNTYTEATHGLQCHLIKFLPTP